MLIRCQLSFKRSNYLELFHLFELLLIFERKREVSLHDVYHDVAERNEVIPPAERLTEKRIFAGEHQAALKLLVASLLNVVSVIIQESWTQAIVYQSDTVHVLPMGISNSDVVKLNIIVAKSWGVNNAQLTQELYPYLDRSWQAERSISWVKVRFKSVS